MAKVQRGRAERRYHHERADEAKPRRAGDEKPSWNSGSRHKALTLELSGGVAVRLERDVRPRTLPLSNGLTAAADQYT
jgi:hypothetical protein